MVLFLILLYEEEKKGINFSYSILSFKHFFITFLFKSNEILIEMTNIASSRIKIDTLITERLSLYLNITQTILPCVSCFLSCSKFWLKYLWRCIEWKGICMNVMAGAWSKSHSEPVHRRSVHRGEGDKRRRLLHPEAGHPTVCIRGTEWSKLRNHPPHNLGIFQPEIRASGQVWRFQASHCEIRQRRRRRLLGNQQWICDRGV